MAPPRWQSYDNVGEDDLLARGAECENRLAEINAEMVRLEPAAVVASRKMAKSAVKLGFNTGLGTAGVVLAPPTFGLSLLLTLGSGLMLIWDGFDMGSDYRESRPMRRRLRQLRDEASDLADELGEISMVLERRFS
jgi:hypothetical protein